MILKKFLVAVQLILVHSSKMLGNIEFTLRLARTIFIALILAVFLSLKRIHKNLSTAVTPRMKSVCALTRSGWRLGWKDTKKVSCKQSRSGRNTSISYG